MSQEATHRQHPATGAHLQWEEHYDVVQKPVHRKVSLILPFLSTSRLRFFRMIPESAHVFTQHNNWLWAGDLEMSKMLPKSRKFIGLCVWCVAMRITDWFPWDSNSICRSGNSENSAMYQTHSFAWNGGWIWLFFEYQERPLLTAEPCLITIIPGKVLIISWQTIESLVDECYPPNSRGSTLFVDISNCSQGRYNFWF